MRLNVKFNNFQVAMAQSIERDWKQKIILVVVASCEQALSCLHAAGIIMCHTKDNEFATSLLIVDVATALDSKIRPLTAKYATC